MHSNARIGKDKSVASLYASSAEKRTHPPWASRTLRSVSRGTFSDMPGTSPCRGREVRDGYVRILRISGVVSPPASPSSLRRSVAV
ncbi:hypothetical protein KC361_g71 [Hortaea werneckii]|nr:hypothetical protein KC361_g71 [Hortaea werneckii]